MKMDLTEIEGEYEKHKIYSFLATYWAVLADIDINSEALRCIGTPRYTLWGVYRTLCRKQYRGSIYFSGEQMNNKDHPSTIQEANFSPDLPELHETAVRHEELEA
jgi:hypothetical protein